MLEAGKFIKKECPVQVFSCKFCKTFKVIYFTEQVPATASGIFRTLSNNYDGAFMRK